jgi:hypothetical protein
MLSRRGICLCCALILIPALLLAQKKALSGSYGGTLGGGALDGTPATVELTVAPTGDLTGVVTGPKLTPGDLKGTYDAKTHSVRFTVNVREGGTSFGFVGVLRNDTLSAKNSDEGVRVFTMRVVRGVRAPALPVAGGPQNPSDPARAAVQRTFTEVSGWVARAAATVPPDKYSYRPTQSVRTFGEQIGHLADAYTYYCTRASGKEMEWSDAIEKGPKDKAGLATKLKTAQDLCTAAYARGQLGALVDNVAHTNLHYGNIITYMRMMGLTPPSS